MSQHRTYTAEQIMEQAQVFASAWALVGGPFDAGDQLVAAELEKDILAAMITAHAAPVQQPTTFPPCDYCGAAVDYMPWHGSGLINGVESRHIHACDNCRNLLPGRLAARDVLAERRRQVEAEGWTPEHDDEHGMGSLASAAGCYAMFTQAYPVGDPPPYWPWDKAWWKPKDRRSNLVRAGALILAEIERLDRAQLGEDDQRAFT